MARRRKTGRAPAARDLLTRRGLGAGMFACALIGATIGLAQEPSEPISPEAQAAISRLESKDVSVRQQAFMQLEALRERATAAVIRRSVDSQDAQTRAMGVRALAAIEGPDAVGLLADRLKHDRDASVRLEALLGLEPLQDSAVLPAILEALHDRSPEVRMAAADALSRVDDPRARQAVMEQYRRERNRDVRQVLEDAVKRIASP